MVSPKVLPSKHRLHPLSREWRGPGGGELLHGALQVSQLCPGLPDSQAGYEPQQGKNKNIPHYSLLVMFAGSGLC